VSGLFDVLNGAGDRPIPAEYRAEIAYIRGTRFGFGSEFLEDVGVSIVGPD
jgi:hypothetical protein